MKSTMTLARHIFLLASLFFNPMLSAQLVTKNVDDGTDGTLRQEILDTSPGGTITFAEGITNILLDGELIIDKDLNIVADSTARVSLDAQTQSRIFNISAGSVTLQNLDLINGISNPESNGGAIQALGANLNLIHVNIITCQALNGGGIYISQTENFTVNGGVFSGNLGFNAGGAFYIESQNSTLKNVLIDSNGADDYGAGIYTSGGNLQISESTISNNTFTFSTDVSISGAGIYNDGGDLLITNSTLSRNDSRSEGGAILSESGSLEVRDSEISYNGARFYGGGLSLFNNTLVKLINVNLSYNSGSGPENSPAFNDGAAIYVRGNDKITIDGGTINDNAAGRNGGGIYLKQGELTINGTEFSGNSANYFDEAQGGGAIYNSAGTLIINPGTQFINNIANNSPSYGGALLIEEGAKFLINSSIDSPVVFQGNYARGFGGAIDYRSTEPLNLTNIVFKENTALYGGALYTKSSGEITIIGGEFSASGTGDESCLEGGAIWNNLGTIIIEGTRIFDNLAINKGGGIYNESGTININNAEFSNNAVSDINISDGGGGAIYNVLGGNLTILKTLIDRNKAYTYGGAIVDNSANASGTISLTNVVFRNNTSDYDQNYVGLGGALYMNGNGLATLTSCELSENLAGNFGGAIYNDSAMITIRTSTLSGNTIRSNTDPSEESFGGAIFNESGVISVDASTIVMNNAAGEGGAFYNGASASTTLKNTIVALNTAEEGANLGGETTFVSADYNLVGEDDLNLFSAMANDLEGTAASPLDPMIDLLANNGGFTQTHALLENSPAYNAGNPVDDFADQRGEGVFAGRRDIGAFESQTNLGIESIVSNSQKALLYPNPSRSGKVSIDLPRHTSSEAKISIIELGSGRTLHTQNAQHGINNLETGNLSAGTYLVKIVSSDYTETLKMLVAR